MRLRTVFNVAILTFAALMVGCGGLTLQGKVVTDDFSSMTFVSPADPRLSEPGLSGAKLSIIRDPGRLNREVVATASSDGSGKFTIDLDVFGAGWMQERWLIEVVRPGHQTATLNTALDKDHQNRRLLITLGRGAPTSVFDNDPMRDFDQHR